MNPAERRKRAAVHDAEFLLGMEFAAFRRRLRLDPGREDENRLARWSQRAVNAFGVVMALWVLQEGGSR